MPVSAQRKSALSVVDIITTDEDKKFEPAGRMATSIIEIIQEKGTCLPQDLSERGFKPAEVDELWHMANSLAEVEMNLLGESSAAFEIMFKRKN